MKRFWNKALAYILAFAMCFSVVNVPVYAQESNITEATTEESVSDNNTKATTEENTVDSQEIVDENDGSTWDQVTTENIFEGENYRVTFTLTSYWDTGYNANVKLENTGYNANIKLENTGDSTIQNWYLGFDYNDSITSIWNAEISSNENAEYVIKNAGWNQDIAAGKSVEFGISGGHAFRGFPDNYKLIGTNTEVAENDYDFYYEDPKGGQDSIGLVNNDEMAFLKLFGAAENFENCGVYHVNIRWTKGQSLSEATQTPLGYSYVGK